VHTPVLYGIWPWSSSRVEKINPVYTSQTCNACRHRDPRNRESQAVFRCRACGHAAHADVNAARNIAVGRTVTARGGRPLGGPVNCEPDGTTFVCHRKPPGNACEPCPSRTELRQRPRGRPAEVRRPQGCCPVRTGPSGRRGEPGAGRDPPGGRHGSGLRG
jgi:hypothetical protein